MLTKPLCGSMLSAKVMDFLHLVFVVIMYIAVCAEADMYVPAFPQMIEYFNIEEYKIQLVLSLNFAGLCLAGLFAGPLSDSCGRRPILLMGLGLLVFSSIGCVITESFYGLLFWRLLQGFGASIPMVIGAATIVDKYSQTKASQMIALVNTGITTAMAAAPIAGAYVSEALGWRANFTIILILAVIAFLGVLLFQEETLLAKKRTIFSVKKVTKDYMTLLQSPKFMGYTHIANFSVNTLVIYVSNLSVIFINHLHIPLETFVYYQMATILAFIVSSMLAYKCISKWGVDVTKNIGLSVALLGAIGLMAISFYDETAVNVITFFAVLLAAGGAKVAATFGPKSLEIFPGMNGTAMALSTAFRQSFAACLVVLSEIMFDGTIVPVATIIFFYALSCALIFALLSRNGKN